MPRFKTFVFDVDGTLAHTNKLIFETFRHVAEKYLSKKLSDEEIIALFGPTEDVILKEWMQDKYEIARSDYFKFYTNKHEKLVKTFEGLEEIIDLIKRKGMNLAVFTGKGKDSTKITLEKLGLNKYFDLIITGDDVKGHKPAPDGLQKVVEYFDQKPEEVLMIGDSPHDIEASKSAKVPIAAVVWDSYAASEIPSMNPDFIFYKIPEFKKFIESVL